MNASTVALRKQTGTNLVKFLNIIHQVRREGQPCLKYYMKMRKFPFRTNIHCYGSMVSVFWKSCNTSPSCLQAISQHLCSMHSNFKLICLRFSVKIQDPTSRLSIRHWNPSKFGREEKEASIPVEILWLGQEEDATSHPRWNGRS